MVKNSNMYSLQGLCEKAASSTFLLAMLVLPLAAQTHAQSLEASGSGGNGNGAPRRAASGDPSSVTGVASSRDKAPAQKATVYMPPTEEREVELSNVCLEATRKMDKQRNPVDQVPALNIIPTDPASENSPVTGLVRVNAVMDEYFKCPGGMVVLYFRRPVPLSEDDKTVVEENLVTMNMCINKISQSDSNTLYSVLCWKAQNAGSECAGGSGVSFTFYQPDTLGGSYEPAGASSKSSLKYCDEKNPDRAAFEK